MLRVLVVDDEQDTRETTRLLLELWGHQTYQARTGAAALRALDEFRPDVVLLDIGLPDMEGYEVARQVLRRGSKRPLAICISGHGQPEDRRKALEAGCDHHFIKPADPDELRNLLRAVQDGSTRSA